MSLKFICLHLALLASLFSPSSLIAAEQTVLITGANRGIGLALAEEFTKGGYKVIGTARKPAKAAALKKLGAQVEQLDVADPASVAALANKLEGTSIDILVNNAGITGHVMADFRELDIEKLDGVFQVNAFGPLRVTQALLPNLEASDRKLILNISSMMGSMELNTWGTYLGYRGSKSALNSFNKTLAVDLAKDGLTFIVVHPGYVQTDMNAGAGNITPTQSASGIFKLSEKLSTADNGAFFDFNGKAMPW